MDRAAFTNLIVTFNSAPEVSLLLADLHSHAPLSRTIVVDNASQDGTADAVQAAGPGVRLVRNSRNVGYARAVNQAFDLCDSEYVFLVNPDIRIESPRVFEQLQACLDAEPPVAVAGPLQFKEVGGKRRLNFTWSYWNPSAFRLYMAALTHRQTVAFEPIRVSFLNAGCLFIRSSAFRAVGKLNEKYFLYGEEPDLFLKLMRHGYECRLLPGAEVLHGRERSLATVPSFRRLVYKLQGGLNIADALISGIVNIALDRLKGSGPG